jgi:1-acylglycerone phosphate reductase
MSPTVLITGCTDQGLGASVAKTFAERGCKVIATLRPPTSRCSLTHPNITILPLDVTSQQSIDALPTTEIDILINNAGRTIPGPVLDVKIEDAKAVMEANVWGTVRVVQAIVPGMLERRRGLVVNIGSCVAIVPTPLSGALDSQKMVPLLSLCRSICCFKVSSARVH